jgi:GNAT superfamily N-acetyltransferase
MDLPCPVDALIPPPSALDGVGASVARHLSGWGGEQPGPGPVPSTLGVTLLSSHYLTAGAPWRDRALLGELLDTLGALSARAQGLPTVITTAARLASSPTQRVYVAFDGYRAVGLLKVGPKDLFVTTPVGVVGGNSGGGGYGIGAARGAAGGGGGRAPGSMVEVHPLSVLDFFVLESHRRQGLGRLLFETMLRAEATIKRAEEAAAAATATAAAAFRALGRSGRAAGEPVPPSPAPRPAPAAGGPTGMLNPARLAYVSQEWGGILGVCS